MELTQKEITEKKRFLTLEVTPLRGLGVCHIINKIKDSDIADKIDAFVVTDNPLARLKSNSVITASKLQEHFKKPSIATMTMRDKNKIALQADLLGANELDVRSILALTGDGAAASDQPKVKGVFEANSSLLLEIIRCFNAGIDYSGKPFVYPPKPISSFAVCNANLQRSKTLHQKIIDKLKFAPVGIISQPVYSMDNAIKLKEIFTKAKSNFTESQTELVFGFFPVTRLRTAQFLNSHVPGVQIPAEWITKLSKAKKISDEYELKTGMELSQKMFKALLEFHAKIHIMGANNFTLLNEMLNFS